jgi:membrane-bound serine protease (ClpP class)
VGVRAFALLLAAACGWLAAPRPAAAQATVDLVRVEGVIDPIVARFVVRALEQAAAERAHAVLLELDTPGGLDASMRRIVQAILNAPVPVIVYVAPPGARAGSAGVFVTLAAHVAAMAPGTNLGAAHPVAIGAGEVPDAQQEKVVNDAAAYVRALAERHGRNADWAERAVRQSVSATAREALERGVIDLVAADRAELLDRLDGRTVTTARGPLELRTRGAEVREIAWTWPERLLHALADPNLAYLLLVVGLWAIVAEFYHPGAVVPAVTGVIALILAFVAFGSLPVNWAGVALIVLAVVLFILDLKVTGFALSVGGAVAFVLGSLMLYRPWRPTPPAMPRVAVDPRLVVAVGLALLGFFLLVVQKTARAQRLRPASGVETLVGARGRTLTPLAPRGTVHVRGEEWTAESVDGPLPAGTEIAVVGYEGLRLRVARAAQPPEEPS